MSIAGIYKIQDTNGKVYIGSAVDVHRRWYEHRRALRLNKHNNVKLQHAYNKYGEKYFTFTVLEIISDKSKLLLQEQKYLNLLFHYYTSKQRYNILRVAGSGLGSKRNDETRSKMSLAQKGKTKKPHSEETKAKISAASKHRPSTAKTYYLISPNGEVEAITNMRSFCKVRGYSFGNMYGVATGKRKSAYGWRLACQQQ